MKFAMSYSCGKDSALALWRMLNAGHEPACLLVTFNTELGRSWFHGVDPRLLEDISQSLKIPLVACPCAGGDYHTALEAGMAKAREMGATACVFGDIDIEGHLEWNRARCENAGLECVLPLWREDRANLAREVVDNGFRAIIKCVRTDVLGREFLGLELSRGVLEKIAATGADVCGENGEYHTLVFDGPIFSRPVEVRCRGILDFPKVSVMDIVSGQEAAAR